MKINFPNQILDLSSPVVMAIINVTPDSFYEGSRSQTNQEIRNAVIYALENGARILDVGAYSSRPGAEDVPVAKEVMRMMNALEVIRETAPDAVLSIDTFRHQVANEVISRFGACIINDISAGELDPKIIEVVAKHDVPYIAMHTKGTPQTMSQMTKYEDVAQEVYQSLSHRVSFLHKAGVKSIMVDPGFGFAKSLEQNYELLSQLEIFTQLNLPLVVGLSRKSMIYKPLDISAQGALPGTIALNWEALTKGASILRVHDPKEAHQIIELYKIYKANSLK